MTKPTTMDLRFFRVEVRPDDDGDIDEVLFYAWSDCLFHLERLDRDRFWFAFYPPGEEDRHFDIVSRKKVRVVDRQDANHSSKP